MGRLLPSKRPTYLARSLTPPPQEADTASPQTTSLLSRDIFGMELQELHCISKMAFKQQKGRSIRGVGPSPHGLVYAPGEPSEAFKPKHRPELCKGIGHVQAEGVEVVHEEHTSFFCSALQEPTKTQALHPLLRTWNWGSWMKARNGGAREWRFQGAPPSSRKLAASFWPFADMVTLDPSRVLRSGEFPNEKNTGINTGSTLEGEQQIKL